LSVKGLGELFSLAGPECGAYADLGGGAGGAAIGGEVEAECGEESCGQCGSPQDEREIVPGALGWQGAGGGQNALAELGGGPDGAKSFQQTLDGLEVIGVGCLVRIVHGCSFA
jgi:hypothetical protein